MNTSMLTKLGLLVLIGFLTACGEGSGGAASTGGADSVDSSLTALGIDTSDKPLLDTNGNLLPDSYTPLGVNPRLNQLDEILTLGSTSRLVGYIDPTTIVTLNPLTPDRPTSGIRQETLISWPLVAATPWAGVDFIRAGASVDLDGDGLEEELVVYQQKSARGASIPANNNVRLSVMKNTSVVDPATNNTTTSFSPSITPIDIGIPDAANFLDIVAGDFDGDSNIDVAVVLMEASQIKIVVLKNTNGILALTNNSITIPAIGTPAELQAVVKVGNLDNDGAQEMAVVVNEYYGVGFTASNSSHVYLYEFDNATSDFKSIPLPNNKDGILSSQFNAPMVVAEGNVALGDVDGDGLDEVILGGLKQNNGEILNAPSTYVVYVLDDAAHGLTELAHVAKARVANPTVAPNTQNWMRYVHLNAVDTDGDGIKEIQANEYIFNNLTDTIAGQNGVATLNQIFYMDPLLFIFANDTVGRTSIFSNNTSNMVAANVLHLSDGREQIIVHSESTPSQRVRVFGLDNNNWAELHSYPAASFTGGNSSHDDDFTFPQRSLQIIPTNVNNDTLKLKYVPGSHKFVYTEPIVIAVLAAAPCWANQGQNTDNCTTAYGFGRSAGATAENTFSVHGGFSFGGKAQGVVNSIEAKVTVEATKKYALSRSRTVSTMVTYTSGGLEDTVIFTSVPVDIYDYLVLSHPSARRLEGQVIQLRSPRTPVVLSVTREYYNAHLAPGGVKIDSAIFQHTPGNPLSYMRSDQKDALVRSGNLVPNPWGKLDKVTHSDIALETPATPIEQGTGFVTANLDLSAETGSTDSIGFDVTLDAEATVGGALFGLSFGGGEESALTMTHGTQMTYTGTVSAMTTPSYPDAAYNFGLFTYYYQVPNSPLQFEVVNYWVEPQ